MYANAFQVQCKCIPGAVQMQYIKGQAKMMANFLAKQMKNTQTSHDIKKGYFIFVGGRKWKPIKRRAKKLSDTERMK